MGINEIRRNIYPWEDYYKRPEAAYCSGLVSFQDNPKTDFVSFYAVYSDLQKNNIISEDTHF